MNWDQQAEENFKNRRRIGFKQGGHIEPIAIENKSRQRYDLLNQKIKTQEENVNKMKFDDPARESEINQLIQMKKVRDKIKLENQFESFKYLKRFNESDDVEDWTEWDKRYDEVDKIPRWWGYQAHSTSTGFDPNKPFIVKKYVGWQEKKEERARLGAKCGFITIGPFRASNEEAAMTYLKDSIRAYYNSNSNKEEETLTQVIKYREEVENFTPNKPPKISNRRKIDSSPLAYKK